MKPDLTDTDLDQLLARVTPLEAPAGLTAQIMANLPERKTGWRAHLAGLLGTDSFALPAGGAFASLMIGLFSGYLIAPVTATDTNLDEAEIALAAAFDTDIWRNIEEEIGQ